MDSKNLPVPTARECVAEAYRLLKYGAERELAEAWIRLAAEIRADALDQRFFKVPSASNPETFPARRTLHDVEAIVCAHGVVALRWKGQSDTPDNGWWTHTDGTNCDDPQVEGDAFRRRSQEMRESQGDGLPGQTMGAPAETVQRQDTGADRATDYLLPVTHKILKTEEDIKRAPTERIEDDPATTRVRPYVQAAEWDRAVQQHPLDDTAILAPRTPNPPQHGQIAVCRNHDDQAGLIYDATDGQWLHTANLSTLCPIPGQTPEGDETYQRFSNPA